MYNKLLRNKGVYKNYKRLKKSIQKKSNILTPQLFKHTLFYAQCIGLCYHFLKRLRTCIVFHVFEMHCFWYVLKKGKLSC